MKPRLTLKQYYDGLADGNRSVLAKAITLIESFRKEDQLLANQLLNNIMPLTDKSVRIGITGVPGVGKSTFIESFGRHITSQNKRVAVLTIDPTSPISKGSILGDKTRMPELANDPLAFIRPSAAGKTLGGVGHRTREIILLCEAAGFEVIVVETVGVGQSEVNVRNMVDFFLLLMLAGAGDELQGIKKGIIEMADTLVITKADGQNIQRAKEAQEDYRHALHLLPSSTNSWKPKVLICSALNNTGIAEIWKLVEGFRISRDEFIVKEREWQNVHWLSEKFYELVQVDFKSSVDLSNIQKDLENKVRSRQIAVTQAAQLLLEAYHQSIQKKDPETKN